MKLTLQELKEMVKHTLNEEKGCAPKKLEDEPDDGIEQAEDSLDNDQVIIRFYENEDKDDDESKLDVHSSEKDDVEGLAARAISAVHDLAVRAGADMSTTVDTGEDAEDDDEDDLKEAIRQEIFKVLKK